MALTNLIAFLKKHPWGTSVVANLVLVLIEKLVEQDFVCPCRPRYTEAFFSLYLLMPLLVTTTISVYLWKFIDCSNSKISEQLRGCICQWKGCLKFLTCAFPSIFWLILFFGDGRFLACLNTPLKDGHIDNEAQAPWEWCDKNRTLTDDQYNSQIVFYGWKIGIFGFLSIFFLVVLIYQCWDRCWVTCCGKCWGRCCSGYCVQCCVQCCGGCCGKCCHACYEKHLDIRLKRLSSSTYKVLCVAKCATKYSGDSIEVSQEVKLALCSVCDGTKIFLITLQESQIHLFQVGETYIVKNATVKDRSFNEMILRRGTRVFRAAKLQLDKKLFLLAMEGCLLKTTNLSDPELYLKTCYVNLSGKVVSTDTSQPCKTKEDNLVRSIEIDQFQEGESNIVKDAKVKDRLFDEMILGSGTGVFWTGKLQLEEHLFLLAKKSCLSKKTDLSDPELYLNKCYLTLSGRVVSVGTSRSSNIEEDVLVRDIEIEQDGVEKAVSLLKEAATEPLEINQMIQITHIKETKNKACGKKLTSSDHTVISVLQNRTEGEEIIFVKVEGFTTENNQIIFLTEDQEELSVPWNLWPRDADQLTQQLPVYLLVTRKGGQVTQVIQENRTGGTTRLVKVEAFDKEEDEYIFLKEDQEELIVHKNLLPRDVDQQLQQRPVYLFVTRKGEQITRVDVVTSQMKERVHSTEVNQKEEDTEDIISSSSEKTALKDPKQNYVTLLGKVVSLSEPRWITIKKATKKIDIKIEKNGVTKSVTLLKEAATKPPKENQTIQITHVKVTKNKACGTKLTSSDHTVISVL